MAKASIPQGFRIQGVGLRVTYKQTNIVVGQSHVSYKTFKAIRYKISEEEKKSKKKNIKSHKS